MRQQWPKPYWIWPVSRKILNYQCKHFYSYFCFFGPHTNVEWNCRLAKRFRVSRSTIKRWLRQLVKLRLIWITSGGGAHRRIHAHYYKDQLEWFTNMAMPRMSLKPIFRSKKLNQAIKCEAHKRLKNF